MGRKRREPNRKRLWSIYDEDLDWTVTYGIRKGEYCYQEVRGNQIRSISSDAEP